MVSCWLNLSEAKSSESWFVVDKILKKNILNKYPTESWFVVDKILTISWKNIQQNFDLLLTKCWPAKHVLTAYHCTHRKNAIIKRPCDHSDGECLEGVTLCLELNFVSYVKPFRLHYFLLRTTICCSWATWIWH